MELPPGVTLRLERLEAELAAAPVIDVVGVVEPPGAAGAGGGNSAGSQTWTLLFDFAAWRVVNSVVQRTTLSVRQDMLRDELRRLMGVLRPYKIFRIRARMVERSAVNGAPNAQMEALIGEELGDAELNAISQELQKPVTYTDPEFGTLTLNRALHCYDGEVVWEGRPARLSLFADDSGNIAGALLAARVLWENQTSWGMKVRNFAVGKLLPLKNESWLDDGEPELRPEDFLSRMRLESISIRPDGSFEFWHSDGDLFWGHSIQISGNLAEGPKHADIPG